jgi:hypothetical protein
MRMNCYMIDNTSKENKDIVLDMEEEDSRWTTEAVKDELREQLLYYEGSIPRNDYREQAEKLIYKIPIYKPSSPFIIYRKDLTDRLLKELFSYDERGLQEVLIGAVERIFMDIDERYFKQSVKRLLKVELRD